MDSTSELLKARLRAADMDYGAARDEFALAIQLAEPERIREASQRVTTALRRYAEALARFPDELSLHMGRFRR